MNPLRYAAGGHALAASRTPAERKARASAASRKRWNVRAAEHEAKTDSVREMLRAGAVIKDIMAKLGVYANFVTRIRDDMRDDGEILERDRGGVYERGEDTSGPRCRCGLRIDADHGPETCDVQIDRYASARRGE